MGGKLSLLLSQTDRKSQAKLGVISGKWLVVNERTVDARPSILRTRLVPSKIIRRQKSTETAEENKVEQATVRFLKN
jgi:hypothetical protein